MSEILTQMGGRFMTPSGNLAPGPGQTPFVTHAPGMIEPGNIDIYNRPQVHHNGQISTVHSVSFDEPGHTVLIPTVIGNQVVEPHEAYQIYRRTGQHLGKFSNWMEADAYSHALHNAQDAYYRGGRQRTYIGNFPGTKPTESPVISPLGDLFQRRGR